MIVSTTIDTGHHEDPFKDDHCVPSLNEYERRKQTNQSQQSQQLQSLSVETTPTSLLQLASSVEGTKPATTIATDHDTIYDHQQQVNNGNDDSDVDSQGKDDIPLSSISTLRGRAALWTTKQEDLLLRLHRQHGDKEWMKIVHEFNNDPMNHGLQRSFPALTQKFRKLIQGTSTQQQSTETAGHLSPSPPKKKSSVNDDSHQDMVEEWMRVQDGETYPIDTNKHQFRRQAKDEVSFSPTSPSISPGDISTSVHPPTNSINKKRQTNKVHKLSSSRNKQASLTIQPSRQTVKKSDTVNASRNDPSVFPSSTSSSYNYSTVSASSSRSSSPLLGSLFKDPAPSWAIDSNSSTGKITATTTGHEQSAVPDANLGNLYPRFYGLRYRDEDGEYYIYHVMVKGKEDDPFTVFQQLIGVEPELDWLHQQLKIVDPAASNPQNIDPKLVIFTIHNGMERVRRLQDIPDESIVTVQLSMSSQKILQQLVQKILAQQVSDKQERRTKHSSTRDEGDSQDHLNNKPQQVFKKRREE